MRVLVTGATGFVGQEVLRELRRQAHETVILARDPESVRARRAGSQFGVVVRPGEVTDAASLRAAIEGTEAVIHLVGIISESRKATFERVHHQATKNLLAAGKASGVRRFLHMSALGTRPNAVSRYHQTKWSGEEEVRGSSLPYTIFRPSIIYGPEDHFVNLYARIIRFSPIVPLLGRGNARLQPVAVECVARAFVAALEEPAADRMTLDLCGPERFTLAEIVDQILTVLGKRRLKVRIPKGIAWAQATVLEWLWRGILGTAPPLNRDQLLMLEEDNVGDPSQAYNLFRLEQRPFQAGIAQYLRRP
jgi:NADH dehydrogenase